MKVVDYDDFVRKTDQYAHRDIEDRKNIALYGLVGEIGSLMSAVKKQLLASESFENQGRPTSAIVEELGDIIWYCFAVVHVFFPNGKTNIFNNEIAFLRRLLTEQKEESLEFQQLLGEEKKADFLEAVKYFPKTDVLKFDDFQDLAFKTARTDGALLRQVCLSVLWQHGAEILRHKLPESERKINRKIEDRKLNYILGDIAWHVSAVARFYNLSLNDVISYNVEKISLRNAISGHTPLHDDEFTEKERFPRRFDVSFISVSEKKSRMYVDGRRLGDDLTDNSYDGDGYRFHDIMHLANAAKLGWSPVLRDLLKLKRKSKPQVDEVEDGARARIVEEAVIKAIHSEGVRLSKERVAGPISKDAPDIFPSAEDVSFSFLKFIKQLVAGLEVHENKAWEWEAAILEGYKIFYSLRMNGQGTVSLDLDARTITYSPDVYVDFSGGIAGIGCSSIEDSVGHQHDPAALSECVKLAVLQSLSLEPTPENINSISIKMLDEHRVSTSASGNVRSAMWDKHVVCFRTAISRKNKLISCTVLAIADAA